MITVTERLVQHLETFLGPSTARIAVKTFAERALSLSPEELKNEHISCLMEAMQPMLWTLLGEKLTVSLLNRIQDS